MRRFNIGDVVVNHERSVGIDAELPDGFQQRRRMRFSVLQAVATHDDREELSQEQRLQDLSCRKHRFAGHDSHTILPAPQRGKRFEDTWVGASQSRRIGLIDFEKAREKSLPLLRIAVRRDRRSLHQLEHAVADHAFNLGCLDRAQAEIAQQPIERDAQVFGAVDECTVEIEEIAWIADNLSMPHRMNLIM